MKAIPQICYYAPMTLTSVLYFVSAFGGYPSTSQASFPAERCAACALRKISYARMVSKAWNPCFCIDKCRMKILQVKLLLIPGDANPVICSASAVPLNSKNNFVQLILCRRGSSHRRSPKFLNVFLPMFAQHSHCGNLDYCVTC